METQKFKSQYKIQLALAFCALSYSELAFLDTPIYGAQSLQVREQRAQVKELLGGQTYKGLNKSDFGMKTVMNLTQKHLPKTFQKEALAISKTIVHEAARHQLDPLFLVAIILTESSFNPKAKGRHGELGLMQILPKTGKWLAQKAKYKGSLDLTNPHVNIKLGAAYLASLRQRFNRVGNRYIAAYNMGVTNVRRLVASKTEPRIYPNKVLAHYSRLHKNARGVQVLKTKTHSVAAL